MHYTLEEIINSHIYDAMCIKCYYTIRLFTMYLKFVVYFQITTIHSGNQKHIVNTLG